MKNLQVIYILLFALLAVSCSSDDTSDAPPEGPTVQANINGGTFSNYVFKLGVYEIAKSSKGNSLSIEMADKSGNNLTMFLNSTDGFEPGTIKQMGNVDTYKAVTYVMIRDGQSQVSYFSKSGSIKIHNNREHPSNSKQRLISGEINIIASSEDGKQTTTMKGSFHELAYTK